MNYPTPALGKSLPIIGRNNSRIYGYAFAFGRGHLAYCEAKAYFDLSTYLGEDTFGPCACLLTLDFDCKQRDSNCVITSVTRIYDGPVTPGGISVGITADVGLDGADYTAMFNVTIGTSLTITSNNDVVTLEVPVKGATLGLWHNFGPTISYTGPAWAKTLIVKGHCGEKKASQG